ncbi:hypothetical protein VNO77_00930 [Canavalia gladiata]|uniref:Uncharacterized protein n=1 Tax=Canavalia gladiata TaxID=3824 RepID=A0AAN9MVM5_CANGL
MLLSLYNILLVVIYDSSCQIIHAFYFVRKETLAIKIMIYSLQIKYAVCEVLLLSFLYFECLLCGTLRYRL